MSQLIKEHALKPRLAGPNNGTTLSVFQITSKSISSPKLIEQTESHFRIARIDQAKHIALHRGS